mgnify:CR=1 FL=1
MPNEKFNFKSKTMNVPIISVNDFSLNYGQERRLHNINFDVIGHQVVALIGPTGSGKSSLLRSICRMNDIHYDAKITSGTIYYKNQDIYKKEFNPLELRRNVGFVFQKNNPFPKNVYENVAYGPSLKKSHTTEELDEIVKESLNAVDLWEELKDSLNLSAYQLTKNQQKRLCIARAIALKPEVLLLDEPCATMDTINTGKIEELINQLKKNYTIIIATHNMQQAARISDQAGYLNEGRLIEFNRTDALFMNPVNPETEAYISGRLG